jgi:hypothetical protein
VKKHFATIALAVLAVLIALLLGLEPARVYAQSIGSQNGIQGQGSNGSGCATSGSAMLKGNGSGGCANAISNTDYEAAIGGNSLAAHNFANSISAAGAISGTQPAFSDISGTASASQMPNPTTSALGGVEAINAVAHEWIDAISGSGIPQLTQPAFSDISGTATSSQVPYAGGLQFGSTPIAATSTAPTSGQCLEYNGTGITGAACSGGGGATPFLNASVTEAFGQFL